MFFFFIFIFLFQINSKYLDSFNDSKIELISEEKSSFFQFSEDFEKIKIAYSIEENNSLINDNFVFDSVFNAFKIGGEIKLYKINFEKKRSLKDVYKKLKDENIYFYIIFFENEKTFSWKVYSVLEEKFLDGTVYQKSDLKKNDINLKISICSDLWKLLFESEITPFDSSLVYIKNILLNGKKYSEIVTVNPFFDFTEKIRLKTNRAISDLSSIISGDNSTIIFSEVTNKNVRIVKLKENGGLSVLIDLPGTSGSLCSIDNDIFYVRSSKIYHCYYDFEKKSFIHEKIKTEKKNDLNASICKGPKKNSIICARNYKIYIIYYQKNKNGSIFVENEKMLSPKDSFSTSVDFNDQSQFIFSSEKIGKYNQIFSYDKDTLERKQLTNSNYSKSEISISPCGNYIAYSVKNNDGTKRIETINVYTKKIKVITENQNCGTPTWII